MDEKNMIEDIRELFQTLLLPQLEGIKGEITGLQATIGALHLKIDSKTDLLDAKMDSKTDLLDAKMDGLSTKLDAYRDQFAAEIRRIDQTFAAEIRRVEETLSTDFVRIESNVDVRLASMNDRLESFRRELLAEVKAAR